MREYWTWLLPVALKPSSTLRRSFVTSGELARQSIARSLDSSLLAPASTPCPPSTILTGPRRSSFALSSLFAPDNPRMRGKSLEFYLGYMNLAGFRPSQQKSGQVPIRSPVYLQL